MYVVYICMLYICMLYIYTQQNEWPSPKLSLTKSESRGNIES